jgi:hypothetical protein
MVRLASGIARRDERRAFSLKVWAMAASMVSVPALACTTGEMVSPSAGDSSLTIDARPDAGEADVRDEADAGEDADGGMDATIDRQSTGAAEVDWGDIGTTVPPLPDFDGSCPQVDEGEGGAPMTVAGHVFAVDGLPLGQETVLIRGMSTITAADGSFSLAGVVAPYDLTVVGAIGGINTYVGLTRADPTLLGPDDGFRIQSASVEASVPVDDAGGPPTWFVLDAPQTSFGGSLEIASATRGSARVNANWSQGSSDSATLLAFSAALLPGGGPQKITAMGTASLLLGTGTYSTQLLVMGPPATPAVLSGSITVPPGYTRGLMQIGLTDGMMGASGFALGDAAQSDTFSYGTFTSNLSWELTYEATSPGGQVVHSTVAGLHGDESSVALDVPSCDLQQVSPAKAATTSSSCVDLSWSATATPASLYVVSIQLGGFYYQLITDHASVQIPYPLPAHTYSWQVRAISPATSVDALAGSLATVAAIGRATPQDTQPALVVSRAECWADPTPWAFSVP